MLWEVIVLLANSYESGNRRTTVQLSDDPRYFGIVAGSFRYVLGLVTFKLFTIFVVHCFVYKTWAVSNYQQN